MIEVLRGMTDEYPQIKPHASPGPVEAGPGAQCCTRSSPRVARDASYRTGTEPSANSKASAAVSQ